MIYRFIYLFIYLFVVYLTNFQHFRLYTGWSRGNTFFKWLVLGKDGVDDIGCESADSSDNAVSVAMVHVEHRVFAVEQFFRNSVENKQNYSYMKNMHFLCSTLYLQVTG